MDGGDYSQFDDAQCDGLMAFLRDITGAEENESIRIAGWYISHAHTDHCAGFTMFAKKYGKQLTLERLLLNFPSTKMTPEHAEIYATLTDFIQKYIKNTETKLLQLHTGQVIQIADMKLEVLLTHEDLAEARTAKANLRDFNGSTSIVKVIFDDKSFLCLADTNLYAVDKLMKMTSGERLKSDVIQATHHAGNNLPELYAAASAPFVFIAQTKAGCEAYSYRSTVIEELKKYADETNIYYTGDGTYGVGVVNGRLDKVYEDTVYGGNYTGWLWK